MTDEKDIKIQKIVDDEVELGFLEKNAAFKLQSHLFPSKFGGKPAWLGLKPLPKIEDFSCPQCDEQMVFLLQIFAPWNDVKHCFHRTLFMFVCRNARCYENSSVTPPMSVFRSQLSRDNDFYSSDPPDEDGAGDVPHAGRHNPLCIICGSLGDKKCSLCKKAYYCCKDHQTLDWRFHKKACIEVRDETNEDMALVESEASNLVLFPEYEIVIEPENYCEEKSEKSEEERMKEYEEYVASSSSHPTNNEETVEELSKLTAQSAADTAFMEFKKRIKHEPEQVVRYQRGAEPLWVSACNLPTLEDIPDCERCGAVRCFEFQVLPQLLRYMAVDPDTPGGSSIDWGTLAIYTCSQSCGESNEYFKEFVWKQDYANS